MQRLHSAKAQGMGGAGYEGKGLPDSRSMNALSEVSVSHILGYSLKL